MCTAKKALDDPWFSTDALDAIAEFTAQVRDMVAAHVAQLDAFQLGPEALARIQFRGLQRMALSNRPTCVGWYTTPNSRRITSATRFRVQICPRNP